MAYHHRKMSFPEFRFVLLILLSASLSHAAPFGQPGQPATSENRTGDEIIICGQYFHTGTAVVLWSDPGGYQAPAFFHHPVTRPATTEPITEPSVEIIRGDDLTLDQLRPHVDQFVIHFDACGLSKECFRVLQRRHLSVHFMCDLDGTIYQTMDLRDDAAHATIANPRSIGVETAQIGCIANDESIALLKQWYRRYDGVTWITIPARFGDGGIRTPHFRGCPLRPFLITGQLQGKTYHQYDYTWQQYKALSHLAATLCTIFPKIQPDYPRQRTSFGPPATIATTQPASGDPTTQPAALADQDQPGVLIPHALSPDQYDAYQGILGHYHVQLNKNDPGPAFQWPLFISETRNLMSRAALAARHQPAIDTPGIPEPATLPSN
jgi:N-acetylmuramoyl-L-alanine amidase